MSNIKKFEISSLYNLILVRYSGEIWLKSQKVKIRLIKVLMNNIKRMLEREDILYNKYQLTDDSTRLLFFFNKKDIPKALELMNKVFGVYSFSPALRTSDRIKNITQRTIKIAKEILENGDSFALRVKRSGDHKYNSRDVARIVGQAVMDKFKDLNIGVDLTNPDKTIFIEIRGKFSYIFTSIIETNWEGLPIEYKKKLITMDVGRLSDILAAFYLLRRGCEIYPIIFQNTNKDSEINKLIDNWREIYRYTPFSKFKIHIIRIDNILEEISNKLSNKNSICTFCRLLRYDLISRILNDDNFSYLSNCKAISDGVNLNKSNFCDDYVDLQSIAVSYQFFEQPIFIPLIALSRDQIKNDLITISDKLEHIEYCRFKPDKQLINLGYVIESYTSLDLDSMIQKVLKDSKTILIK
ncbi:MAG: hypothetical protein GF317_23025 [Candidatus Lokiarchaeota archaeon]|nr:hypothetical protein [Candidatus Lokiarchaeota archaeon]MBD3202317.1 hypothetical protein [Candidatus Lokiarchaeota archaeon]